MDNISFHDLLSTMANISTIVGLPIAAIALLYARLSNSGSGPKIFHIFLMFLFSIAAIAITSLIIVVADSPQGKKGDIEAQQEIERIEDESTRECISDNCKALACLAGATHLPKEKLDALKILATARENAPSCKAETRSFPLSPVWQQLSKALALAEQKPSAQSDEDVREANSSALRSSQEPLSDEQRQLMQRAEPIIRRLDDSDARLTELRTRAGEWRNRTRFEAPDFGDAKGNITPYDMQRLDENGYRADWETLEAAEELLKWPKRGFTAKILAVLPVYLDPGTPHQTDALIASELKNKLAWKIKFTDRYHAALSLQITDARSYYTSIQNAALEMEPHGSTSFKLEFHWIDGNILRPLIINAESTDINGPDDTREQNVKLNSMHSAVDKACNSIFALAGDQERCSTN